MASTLTEIRPYDINEGDILNGRIVTSVIYHEDEEVFDIATTGRGARVRVLLTDRIIRVQEDDESRPYILAAWPTPKNPMTEKDYHRFQSRS